MKKPGICKQPENGRLSLIEVAVGSEVSTSRVTRQGHFEVAFLGALLLPI